MSGNSFRCLFVPLLVTTLDVRRLWFLALASFSWVLGYKVAPKTVSNNIQPLIRDMLTKFCRWNVYCRTRNYRLRTGIQYHCGTHPDHGTCISYTESAHGQHIQFVVESWCDCSCMDNLWHVPYHEQLGMENPVHSPGIVQRYPDFLLLVDCRISAMAC
jgi:hypothetical protein